MSLFKTQCMCIVSGNPAQHGCAYQIADNDGLGFMVFIMVFPLPFLVHLWNLHGGLNVLFVLISARLWFF